MTTKIGINGFGRIGRQVFKAVRDFYPDILEVVAVNDIGDVPTMAHLLKYDSILGRLGRDVQASGDSLTVDGHSFAALAVRNPAELPWGDLGADIVIESTGIFTDAEKAKAHLDAGAKKVIISAPASNEDITIVMGINDHLYDPNTHHLVTAASCTTNSLAPVVKVLHESVGIERGSITTIHDVTNTQVIVDAPHNDLRRARSALQSLIPTSTGSATAITLIYPELAGKLNGLAVRVPLLNASLTDAVFTVKEDVTVDQINGLFEDASTGALKGILGYETRPLVSADFVNDPRSGIVDALSTMVIDSRMVKVLIWYDNEYGYAFRMADLAAKVAATL